MKLNIKANCCGLWLIITKIVCGRKWKRIKLGKSQSWRFKLRRKVKMLATKIIKGDERWHLIFIESASIERRDVMMKWEWNLFIMLLSFLVWNATSDVHININEGVLFKSEVIVKLFIQESHFKLCQLAVSKLPFNLSFLFSP